ncbi:MAG TPA: hypothetical protein VFD95_13110, partial [Usitatibacter sp.]|nr:hypothetical protein [Usitatibacter sp.]
WHKPEHAGVDIFIPTSAQTERAGTYTNFAGVESAFQPCFDKPAGVMHAAELFAEIVTPAKAGVQPKAAIG